MGSSQEKAEKLTENALETIEEYNNILLEALKMDDRLNWDILLKRDLFKKKFIYEEKPPILLKPKPLASFEHIETPKKSFIEIVFPFLKRRRIELQKK